MVKVTNIKQEVNEMRIGDFLYFSPNVKFTELEWNNRELLIRAFIDRVEGFYLKPTEKLDELKKGFATGVLCVTAIDFLARISTAIKEPGKRIVQWLNDNIEQFRKADTENQENTLAYRFYKDFRNGLVHEGRIKRAGQFSYDFPNELLRVVKGIIIVNPHLLLEAINRSFRKYMDKVEREGDAFQGFRSALEEDFREDAELSKSIDLN